jgi:branched-chain amino acid transport system ATP-binding protein
MSSATPSAAISGPHPEGLSLRGVTQHFGQFVALSQVSLDVALGERTALIGPNGAGKTSLLNAITGQIKPTQGQVWLQGRDVSHWTPQDRALAGLARGFQRSSLFGNLSVADNLRCAVLAQRSGRFNVLRAVTGRQEVQARTHTLLQDFGLAANAEKTAGALAYADQRRLELAMVFANDAAAVVLDEPCAGLNPDETRHMMALIQAHSAGKALLLVEHDMKVVFALADRIAVLDQGQLIALDTPTAIRSNRLVRQAYLGGLDV